MHMMRQYVRKSCANACTHSAIYLYFNKYEPVTTGDFKGGGAEGYRPTLLKN